MYRLSENINKYITDRMAQPLAQSEDEQGLLNAAQSPCTRRQRSISHYISKALVQHPHLANADVFAYRELVQRKPPRPLEDPMLGPKDQGARDGFELSKNSQRAKDLQTDGNELYLFEKLVSALAKYNESLCWAPGDSTELVQGYMRRSALLFAYEEYEFCLEDIARAKRLDSTQRLLPILQDREAKCRKKINDDESRRSKPCPKSVLNVEVNPSLPCVAKGIGMTELPNYGRCLVAERDFQTGDVILHEKPIAIVVEPEAAIFVCHRCGSEKMSSMPCPHCVSAMFCSEECALQGWKEGHRFECGLWNRLSVVPLRTVLLGPRMFFLGLHLFGDNVGEMMAYCEANGPTTVNPFDLDKSEEAFKAFHTAKVLPVSAGKDQEVRFLAAMLYSIYMKYSPLKSLLVGEAQRNFFLRTMYEYMIKALRLTIDDGGNHTRKLYTIALVCNHSCYPNVEPVYWSGELRFVAIRPIARSDQITINYVPHQTGGVYGGGVHRLSVMEFDCECVVCTDHAAWMKNDEPLPMGYRDHWHRLMDMQNEPHCTVADKLNAHQQFIQLYAHVQPLMDLLDAIASYRELLQDVIKRELIAKLRRETLASLNMN